MEFYLAATMILFCCSMLVVLLRRRPLYVFESTSEVINLENAGLVGGQSKLRVLTCVLLACVKSLRFAKPAILTSEYFSFFFRRIFPHPQPAILLWGRLGYYAEQLRSSGGGPKTVLLFNSRISLLLFPILFIFLWFSHFFITLIIFVIYVSGLGLLLTAGRIVSLLNGTRLRLDPELQLKRATINEYIETLLSDRVWPWEPGYIVLKALEGYQFRKALRLFPPVRPNCEFGVDTGIVSSLHLKDVRSVDVGCEVIRDLPILGSIRYGELKNCYIESNPFFDAQFKNIYLIHIVDHIPELDKAFSELHRILSSGGKVYFSGLSHSFSGLYLEQICAAGNVHNNRSVEWYADLAKRHGFRVLYGEYFQGGINSKIFKFTYPFPNRTQAWSWIRFFYRKSNLFRRFWIKLMKGMTNTLAFDEALTDKKGVGLNFMFVFEKI